MTTAAPAVSVIIPAYNAAATVATTIRSVLTQTVQDFEVIVVDDGSTDDTRGAALTVGDERVRVLRQDNAGAAAARNAGMGAARGRVLALLDADDLWLRHKLQRQLAHLDRRPDVGVLQSGAVYVDDEMRVLRVRRCRPSVDPLMDTLRFRNLPAFASTAVVTRAALDLIGPFDPSLEILEDWDFAMRAAAHGVLDGIAEPLTLYRFHAGNRSRDAALHTKPGLAVLDRLFARSDLPARVRGSRSEVYARLYLMFAGASLRDGRRKEALRWLGRAISKDPRTGPRALGMPVRRLMRRYLRQRAWRMELDSGPCPSCGGIAPAERQGSRRCLGCGERYRL